MKKIISLFKRNYDTDRLVRDEITPGAEWVANGEGIATRKFDGTCCLIRDFKLFKRYEVKPEGIAPSGFEPANEVDPETGKQQGWLPVTNCPDDKWHREALNNTFNNRSEIANGTYELCGPKIQGNPERFLSHQLVRHGIHELPMCPRDFNGIKSYLSIYTELVGQSIEGIVWHHPDGRMVKIKARDFSIKRK